MMISILIPTRGRINYLETTLNSIIDNSYSDLNYEILIGIDNDDVSTINFLENFTKNKKNIIPIYFENRHFYRNLHKYFNRLAEKSNGQLIWTLSDDCKILSKHWDIFLKKYENDFKYIKVNIIEYKWTHNFSLIPIIPRKWFELTKRISDYSQIDAWLWSIVLDIDLDISIHDYNIVVSNFIPANGNQHSRIYVNKNGESYGQIRESPDLKEEIRVIRNYLVSQTLYTFGVHQPGNVPDNGVDSIICENYIPAFIS